MLRQGEPPFRRAEDGLFRHPDILDGQARMVRRHVEGPHIFFDDYAGITRRDDQAGDAFRVAILAAGAAEQHDVRRDMHAGDPHLLAIDQPAILAVLLMTYGAGFHMGRVGAVVRLGQAETGEKFPVERIVGEMLLIRTGKVP